jgi:hypothetical protein
MGETDEAVVIHGEKEAGGVEIGLCVVRDFERFSAAGAYGSPTETAVVPQL